jgi:hypothetical protein
MIILPTPRLTAKSLGIASLASKYSPPRRRHSHREAEVITDPNLEEYVKKLVEASGRVEFWLMGSRANNVHRPDNDYDLLHRGEPELYGILKGRRDLYDARLIFWCALTMMNIKLPGR